ncbi:YciI family protein [Pseudonocardia sichuanensis]
MRYMLLVYGCERADAGTPERAAKVAAVRAFTRRCAEDGVLRGYDPLHTTDSATTVRVRDGDALVTDGPFAETAEQLGGYFILDCADLDEALAYATMCPLAAEGSVEVRPILQVSMEPAG